VFPDIPVSSSKNRKNISLFYRKKSSVYIGGDISHDIGEGNCSIKIKNYLLNSSSIGSFAHINGFYLQRIYRIFAILRRKVDFRKNLKKGLNFFKFQPNK